MFFLRWRQVFFSRILNHSRSPRLFTGSQTPRTGAWIVLDAIERGFVRDRDDAELPTTDVLSFPRPRIRTTKCDLIASNTANTRSICSIASFPPLTQPPSPLPFDLLTEPAALASFSIGVPPATTSNTLYLPLEHRPIGI